MKYSENCPLCDKVFQDTGTFSEHMSSVHAPTCTTCQQSFDSISQFTQHLLDKHAERDNHTCSLCHYGSNSESDLKEHILKEHEKCEYCNIQLKDSEALRNHSEDKHKFVDLPLQ